MASLVWDHNEDDTWTIRDAPQHIEMSLVELCGANNEAIHAEGMHLVIDNKVWYLPTGYDTGRGILHLLKDRDDREV